jgi:uncharacterized protein (TIGR03083 family)
MPDDALTALHRSHERFVSTVNSLSDERVAGPSYDDEWSIGQVCSHLASGATVFEMFVDAGAHGTPAPGIEQFQPIWGEWDAKSPVAQARESLAADRALLDAVDALSEDQQAAWRLDMFGMDMNLPGLVRMRLAEHAVHTWDIQVVADPAIGVAEDATAIIVDNLAMLVGRAAKPAPDPRSIRVITSAPERAYDLTIGPDGATLTDASGDPSGATLALAAESFVRLVYGRLDPDHTPTSVTADGIDLELLRTVFPGV